MKSITDKVKALISPYLSEQGMRVYDLLYVKEGKTRFLRLYIDKPQGLISMDDCENVSRHLSDLLDETDFIPEQYVLEVSSPGIERKLKYDWHFDEAIGKTVEVKLFSKINNQKSLVGTLLSGSEKGAVSLKVLEDEVTIEGKEIAEVSIYFDFWGE